MTNTPTEAEIIRKLIAFADKRPDIHAAILTSSRTIPGAPVDPFSDYDAVYVVDDIHPYFDDREAPAEFGPVLTLFHDPIHVDAEGFEVFGNITQYESGLKIDFCYQPVAWLKWLVSQPELPEDFDLGYTVLLDKDGLAARLKPPSAFSYDCPLPQGGGRGSRGAGIHLPRGHALPGDCLSRTGKGAGTG